MARPEILWSFSKRNCAKECLHRYWINYVQKNRGVGNMATIRGKEKHKIFERLILKEISPDSLPEDDARAWERVAPLVMGGSTLTEHNLSVGRKCVPVKNPYLQGNLDVVETVRDLIIDWKTGQSEYYDYRQAQYYALLYMANFPNVDMCQVSFIFPYIKLDQPEAPANTFYFQRKNMLPMWMDVREDLDELGDLISMRDPKAIDEWEPDLEACSSCLVWNLCTHNVKEFTCPKKIL